MSVGGSDAAVSVQTAPAASREFRWAQTLRVHLSVIIVALLIAISAPLMWLTYSQGTSEAISLRKARCGCSASAPDRYEACSDGASVVKMASVLPCWRPSRLPFVDAKKDFMMEALKGSVHLDGVYAGYPGGSFVQLIDVEHNERWRAGRFSAAATAFAMRTILRTAQGAASTWRFLDAGAGARRARDRRSLLRSAPPPLVPRRLGAPGPCLSALTCRPAPTR